MGINGRSDLIVDYYNKVNLFCFRPRWGLTAVLTQVTFEFASEDYVFPSPMGINGRSDYLK